VPPVLQQSISEAKTSLPHELNSLENSSRPGFLWAKEADCLLWANQAAALFLGYPTLDELLKIRFLRTPLAAQIEMLHRALRPNQQRLELIRIPARQGLLSFIGKVTLLNLENQAGILIVGPEIKITSEKKGAGVKEREKAGKEKSGKALIPFKEGKIVSLQKLQKENLSLPKQSRKESLQPTSSHKKPQKKEEKRQSSKQNKNLRSLTVSKTAKPSITARKLPLPRALEPHEQENLQEIARALANAQNGVPLEAFGETLPEIMSEPSHLPPDQNNLQKKIETLEGKNHALQNELHQARILSAELQAILDTATDGILILDRDGHILNMNHPAEALFGQDLVQLAGENLIDLLDPASHEIALNYLHKIMNDSSARALNDGREVIGLEKKGGQIPLFMTLGWLGDSNSHSAFCAVLRDITQWKQAEAGLIHARKRAEAASEQKSDFLAKMSHEIRTPLNAIIGFSEVMLEERFGPVGNERYTQYLKDIHTSGGFLLSLVNDLLDLSKIEAGKLDLIFASVSLNELALQAISMVQPQANRNAIILRSSLQPVPRVIADMRSIRQILLNLLSNAIRFTPDGGQVIVSTLSNEDGSLSLRVRDTGIGMTEFEIALAMEPFRQIKSEHDIVRNKGTGLGLPISKALAEANHARFDILSEPKKGTLASITFPESRLLID
jgi:PAS domain S-box-containing protein